MIVKTAVSEALDSARKSNQRLFVTSLYKYSDFKSKVAIEKLLEIDFIKNNFSEGTLRYYLSTVRNFILTGERNKKARVPEYVYEITQELKERCYAKLTPTALDKYEAKEVHKKEKTISSPVKVSKQFISELQGIKDNLISEDKEFSCNIQKLKEKIAEMEKRKGKIQDKVNAINIVIGL